MPHRVTERRTRTIAATAYDCATFVFELSSSLARDGDRTVIKRLSVDLRDREDLDARLRAEGAFLRELDGEHGVLRIYDIMQSPTALVLERAAGGSLAEHLPRRSLTVAEAIHVLRAVAGAVAHAHAHDIIHRDIKPSNILFTANGEARLADFGIAVRRGARSTAEGWDDINVGTLGYAAPELLRDPSAANTEPVDIYGLGALLHELLLGALPHMMQDDETEADLRARIVAGATRDTTPRESELSPSQCEFLDAALAPDPSLRPQSVPELLARLDAL